MDSNMRPRCKMGVEWRKVQFFAVLMMLVCLLFVGISERWEFLRIGSAIGWIAIVGAAMLVTVEELRESYRRRRDFLRSEGKGNPLLLITAGSTVLLGLGVGVLVIPNEAIRQFLWRLIIVSVAAGLSFLAVKGFQEKEHG